MVTPHTNERANNIRLVEVQKQPSMGSFKQDQIWYRGQKGIYNSGCSTRGPVHSRG